MKKFIYIFISFILFLSYINCNASINTYTRTNDNLYLPSDVKVTPDNIDNILKTPAVSSKEKIYDYADLFTDKEEDLLYDEITKYINHSTIDLAIVTTNNLNGKHIADYAYDFYDYNDFASSGVVFVIYKGTGDPEIFMGNSGSENDDIFNIYSDDRINAILSYIYNDLKNGNYYKGVSNYIKLLEGFYDRENGDYKVDPDGKIVKVIPWFEIIILSISLTFIIMIFCLYKIKSINKTSYSDYLDDKIDNNTLVVRKDLDEEINS